MLYPLSGLTSVSYVMPSFFSDHSLCFVVFFLKKRSGLSLVCKAGLEIGLLNVLPHSHSLGRFPSFHSATKKESKIFHHWGPRERGRKRKGLTTCV